MTATPTTHRDEDTLVDEGLQTEAVSDDGNDWLFKANDTASPSTPRKAPSLQRRKERDELLSACVLRLKMTAPQITEFSRTWEFPFYNEAAVWRRVIAMRLDKKLVHVSRQSLHDEWTLRIFIKIARDAIRNGFPVHEIAKEHRIGDGSKIRADMKWRIANRLFYLETQHSSLTYVGWKAKLGKYLKYRRRSRPFRVLIVMENEENLNTVLNYAREVMAPSPNLTVFYFALMQDLLGQFDTVREDVWRSHRYEAISLM